MLLKILVKRLLVLNRFQNTLNTLIVLQFMILMKENKNLKFLKLYHNSRITEKLIRENASTFMA